MQTLPMDVLLYIICDYFHNDSATLRSASLICHDTQSLSQSLLFNRITILITAQQDCRSVTTLKNILTASKRIVAYVKQLHLVNGMKHKGEEACRAWARDNISLLDEALKRILKQASIDTLSLDSLFSQNGGLIAGGDTLSLIQQLCQSPSIQALELRSVPGEMLTFPVSPNLKRLTASSLYYMSWKLRSPADRALSPSGGRAHLDSLSFYSMQYEGNSPDLNNPYEFLLSPQNTQLCTSSLRHVAVWFWVDGHYHQLARILLTCATRVEFLDLKIFEVARSKSVDLALEALPRLREIRIAIPGMSSKFAERVEWIGRALTPRQSSSALGSLLSLVIHLTVDALSSISLDNNLQPVTQSLGSLANLLWAQRWAYPCLKSIQIRFAEADFFDFSWQTARGDVRWKIANAPCILDLPLRDALKPLKEMGVEVNIESMSP
ncbi:hypothetical protein BKA70DRAFT_1256750, partial [Coprinopsis sp. MPI-PUGE-AT-0042]